MLNYKQIWHKIKSTHSWINSTLQTTCFSTSLLTSSFPNTNFTFFLSPMICVVTLEDPFLLYPRTILSTDYFWTLKAWLRLAFTIPWYMKWERNNKTSLHLSKHSPLNWSNSTLALLPLTIWLFSHNQNYSPFLSRVIKGESLRNSHLIIARRVRSIIPLIISTIRRLLSRLGRGRKSKTVETRLSASDTINPSILLTHLIRKIVKTNIKINRHVLKLIHDGSKRCLYLRRRRWSRWKRGLRGMGSILRSMNVSLHLLSWSRLHTRQLSS